MTSSSPPLVSIVTPSFNQAAFLEETIRSVLAQDYPNLEYIVIDGGSTDGSVDIIQQYGDRLAWWCSEKDRGQADGINKGWQRAHGAIWSFLNSDDVLLPGAVRAVVAAFAAHPLAGLVHGDWLWIDAEGREMSRGQSRVASLRDLLRRPAGICQPATFYSAQWLGRVGLLDETLHVIMDYELALRLAQVSEMAHVPYTLAASRLYPTTKSATLSERMWQELFTVWPRYSTEWMLAARLGYCRYRLLRAMPGPVQRWFRRWRHSPNDIVYLQSGTARTG